MGGIVSGVTDAIGLTDSDAGADASRDAANIQAKYQREALDYLKQREALPQQYREGALGLLGGLYGLNAPSAQPDIPPRPEFTPPTGGGGIMDTMMNKMARQKYDQELADWESQYGAMVGREAGPSQAQAIQQIQSNPLFQATLGQIPQQEQAILRNQSATGAMRSGATDAMLAENQRQNQLSAYQNTLGGLQGLANLPSNAGQIAQQTAGIGQTMGQGIVGAAQSQQAGQQAGFGNLLGLGSLGLSAFSAFCDPALKSDAVKVGEMEGYNIYRWKWNDDAANLGLFGNGYGPMADEIEKYEPERIEIRNGYKYVRAA